MPEIAIYDMDRTITRSGTYTPWLVFYAWHRAPWRLLLLPVAALAGLAYGLKLITRKRVKEINQWLLLGPAVDRARLTPMAEAYARRILETNVYPDALAQIASDKAAGRRVVLATASHRYYVDAIAKRLGVADVIATGSIWDARDRLTWRIEGDNCYGAGKLGLVEAWFKAQRIARSKVRVRFYSDHASDLPVFDWSDEPYAVNASQKLRDIARERGWPTIDWS